MFNKIAGSLTVISAGNMNAIWGVNKKNHIYKYEGNNWKLISGSLRQLSVGHDGTVWGVNPGGNIYRREGNAWKQLNQVAVGNSKTIWGITTTGDIYRWNVQTNAWEKIVGQLHQISVNRLGNVYGLYNNTIYEYNGKTWVNVQGMLNYLDVDHEGTLRGVYNGQVFEKQQAWVNITNQFPANTTSFSSVNKNFHVALDKANGIHFKGFVAQKGGAFIKVKGSLKIVSTRNPSHVWGINQQNNIYQWNGKNWNQISGSLLDISVGEDGAVWGIGQNNRVYQWQNGQWIDKSATENCYLKDIAVGNSFQVFGIDVQGGVWNRDPMTRTWKKIPGMLEKISVNSHGHVYGVTEQGGLFQLVSNQWKGFPGKLDIVCVDENGQVWGCMKGQVYSWKQKHNVWKNVTNKFPKNTTHISVINQNSLWAVDKSGGIHTKTRVVKKQFNDVYFPTASVNVQQFQMPGVSVKITKSGGQMKVDFPNVSEMFVQPNVDFPNVSEMFVQPNVQVTQQVTQPEMPPMGRFVPDMSKFGQPAQPSFIPPSVQITTSTRGGMGQMGGMAMNQRAFASFIQSLKKEAFSAGKKRVITSIAQYNFFSCSQMVEVIKNLSFSADKQHAIAAMAPKIIDKQNKHTIYSVLTFSSEKKYLDQHM